MFSVQVERSSPSVNIVGTIEGNKLILENRGGESLSLDTEIILDFNGGSRTSIIVDDSNYLDDGYKNDGKWNIGERFTYPLNNLINFSRFYPVNITIVDKESNSVVMMGAVKEARVADVKVEMSVSDETPDIGQNIIFYITVRNQNGPCDAAGIVIRDILPGSLTYISNVTSQGAYNSTSNIWNVGDLNVGRFVTLNITATVSSYGHNSQLTQLALLLDGSASITDDAWKLMRTGLAESINDSSVFPRDGSVELTVVQFGVSQYCARVEVYPIVVTNDNYLSIKTQISKITKGVNGYTPMAAGIYLAADTLFSSDNFGGFQPSHRQIINLVTDGNPNVVSGQGELCGDRFDGYPQGQAAAEDARYYILNKLSMSEDQDEFDVVAVLGTQEININWLKGNISWPNGYLNWPPTGPGWVHRVNGYQGFVDSLDQQFSILFKRIDCSSKLISSTYMDPNPKNDEVTISIYPNSQ